MKFKGVLIASDLDGTLFNSEKQISEKNAIAIDYFQKNGGTFTIATGRSFQGLAKRLNYLEITEPLLLVNGALIYDLNLKRVIHSKFLPENTFEIVSVIIERFPLVGCEVFTNRAIHLLNYNLVSKIHLEGLGVPIDIMPIRNLPALYNWVKVNFTHSDANYLKRIEKYVLEKCNGQFHPCFSSEEFFEITNPEARKDIAVFELAKQKGISKEHIYTIGDSFNDFEMIRDAKIGFCPENAADGIKEISGKIVSDNDHDPLLDMIKYLDNIY